jgi:hypothetical protein
MSGREEKNERKRKGGREKREKERNVVEGRETGKRKPERGRRTLSVRGGREKNWEKEKPIKEMERRKQRKDMRGEKREGSKETGGGVPQVTDFAQRAKGSTTAPQHHSGALELHSLPLFLLETHHRLSAPHPGCFLFPFPTLPAAQGTLVLSLTPHSHPQPFHVPSALTSPPHAPCLLRSFTQHHQPISSPSPH